MNPVVDALGKVLADLATVVSQRALAADPALHARLEALQGNCVELRCIMPEAVWHVIVDAGSLTTVHGPAVSPHATVAGNAIELAGWLLPGNASSGVQVQGDAALVAEISDILKDFNPDFGPALSEVLGPDVSANLLGAAELGLQGLRSLIEGVGERNQSGRKPS